MPALKKAAKMMEGHGFGEQPDPGFQSFVRRHPDGRVQVVRFVWWANAKVAAERGVPRSHLTVCPCLAVEGDTFGYVEEAGRFKIPLVDWPSTEQKTRPWSEVTGEFGRVFMPALDAPLADGLAILAGLDDRYRIEPYSCG